MKDNLIVIIIAAILSFFVTNANAGEFEIENFYNKKYCAFLDGTYGQWHKKVETGATGASVDCETATVAWEGEWAYKSYEGVGQSLWYASITGKIPGIIFYLTKAKNQKFIDRAILTFDSLGIDYRIMVIELFEIAKGNPNR